MMANGWLVTKVFRETEITVLYLYCLRVDRPAVGSM